MAFSSFSDVRYFDDLRDAMTRTFSALRGWPVEGARLGTQFADMVDEGRREADLREALWSRGLLRINSDLLRRARLIANSAPVVNLDLIIRVQDLLQRVDSAATTLDLEIAELQRRARQFATN